MASEMTSAFREFALKKLSEAKQRGATLATVTAATAASLTSNVPVPAGATSFVFRSSASTTTTSALDKEPLALDRKLTMLRETNAMLKKTARNHATETLDDAIGKIDLVNESLAYSIENVQECSHVLKMLHRQLRDLGTLRNADDLHFYRPRAATHGQTTGGDASVGGGDSGSAARHAEHAPRPTTSAERFAAVDGADYDYEWSH